MDHLQLRLKIAKSHLSLPEAAPPPPSLLSGFELPALPLTHPGSQVAFQEPMPLEPPVIFSVGLVKRRRQIQIRGYEIDFGIFLFSFSASLRNSWHSPYFSQHRISQASNKDVILIEWLSPGAQTSCMYFQYLAEIVLLKVTDYFLTEKKNLVNLL